MTDYKILVGNCMETLRTLPEKSVDCCVTSPPYFGLRDYGTGKWEGGQPDCNHQRDSKHSEKTTTGLENMNGAVGDGIYKSVCAKCGAVRIDEQIGLEETPEAFIAKLVEVFREVKRVLTDEGTLWVNIGDSYSGSGKGPAGNLGANHDERNMEEVHSSIVPEGTKPKDLIGIPWMLAFALRADGWYLRQDIIWHKPNPMPESVQDRCTKSHEYIFLLSKSAKYYFNSEAIQEKATFAGTVRGKSKNITPEGITDFGGRVQYDTRNKRSVWTVATKPYAEAHFATYPPELITPCILAGCPEGGTVLDPFGGSGTTAQVAMEHHRNAVLCELNPEYVEIMKRRLSAVQPQFLL
jgi:site-specific DNA-methyltransferase (adenine-specific)